MKRYASTLLAALLSAACLMACGGGDDEPEPETCIVDGKPRPRDWCL